MRTIVNGPGTLYLGKQGENLVRVLAFPECALWRRELGEGSVQLLCRPPGGAVYSAGLELEEDGTALWTIAEGDLAQAGYGRCELRWSVGEQVVKSRTYSTFVAESLCCGLPEEKEPEPVDHRSLSHREDADQHPMGAITGLYEAISGVAQPLTNLELEEMMK